MLRRRRERQEWAHESLVRALASWFQDLLKIPVLVREFYWAGKYGPCKTSPSSLVTIFPFAPGGQRRLVLNLHHPLILEIAKAYASGQHIMAIERIAAGILRSASWPIFLDVSCSGGLSWKMAAGLICGPQANMIGPVAHEDCGRGRIKIWPRQIFSMMFEMDRSLAMSVPTKRVVYFGDKWTRRDEMLQLEWTAMMKGSGETRAAVQLKSNEVGLITFAPSLPVLLLAQVLQESPSEQGRLGDCTRVESLTVAAKVLLSADKLFCLSLFFGVPLIDRTRTWKNSIRVNHVFPPPPTVDEVSAYQQRVKHKGPLDALEETLFNRAKAIWAQSKNKKVTVCWSGGIDSTVALVSLLKTANDTSQLQLLHDDESLKENPSFYEEHVVGKLRCIHRAGRTLSEVAQELGHETILVTGELGDQLFGSDRCRLAFPADPVPPLSAQEEQFVQRTPEEIRFSSLEAPWEEALFPVLEESGFLVEGRGAWRLFFQSQLSKSPVPITTIFDLLWWLNFSCKWQNVALRCLHDGGIYRPNESLTEDIVHFFQDRDLECWSCVSEYHNTKFADLRDWKTYKQPLKEITHKHYPNDDYCKNKLKTWSLNFELGEGRRKRVDQTMGLVLSSDGSVAELSSGATSIMDISPEDFVAFKKPDGTAVHGAEDLLESWILNTSSSEPPIKIPTLHVDPWGATKPGAFDVASQFAHEDERQRRIHNPVTSTTLLGKCSALLDPELVKGKTVLDLGACLGAMCHWSLYHGARQVVGVEPQPNFCERMEQFMSDARSTWPERPESDHRYRVVCADAKTFLSSCANLSFDIIVVAGVMHCFQDPISILIEMARVAECIVIESVNPTYHTSGFNDTEKPLSQSSGILEMAPSASVNKAGEDVSFTGLATIPSEFLVRKIMTCLGYEVMRITLQEHPTKNDEVLTYTGNRRGQVSPVRFFLRCTRRKNNIHRIRSLEECVTTGCGNERKWTSRRCRFWTEFGESPDAEHEPENESSPENDTDLQEETGHRQEDEPSPWVFDEAVANRFRSEAENHIPDYAEVVESCLHVISRHFGESALPNLRVVDVGCAIGYTMVELLKLGVGNVYGFDISKSMLKVAEQNLKAATENGKWTHANYHLFLAESPTEAPSAPPAGFSSEELDVAIINWTLHFILNAEDRKSYLRQVFNKLKPGGLLLLTEKTDQDDITRELYYDWKAMPPQSVPLDVIQAKRLKLVGVLETLPVSWYISTLGICGYHKIVVLRAMYAFVTFLCYKPKPDALTDTEVTTSLFRSWKDVEHEAQQVIHDGSEEAEPFMLAAWGASSTKASITEKATSMSTFGFVQAGEAQLCRTLRDGRIVMSPLLEGMYFSVAGPFQLTGGTGFVASSPCPIQPAFFQLGGPLEDDGCGLLSARLPYIDGCTDSLLVAPVVKGAPCLNHVHFPANTAQTQHTHPSARAGIVFRGRGVCHVAHSLTKEIISSTPLEPGAIFCIPSHVPHAFATFNEPLDFVVFHPDSDFGPTPNHHPMINRTIIGGMSTKHRVLLTHFTNTLT